MIAAFLRGDISDYMDALIMVERLGAMIAEYSGTLVDTDQDYFTPRSTHVSEAILSQAEQRALKRVLMRFHSNISRLRICRFDIFRRTAYDADLAMRAFSNWTDGLGFYEMVSRRDDSAFVKQQAAIYLSKKHRYREAFQWIDSALLQSRNRIFSIRNSHAIILFQANINQDPEDPTVRDTLTRSMDILRQCYSDDKRKLFHAITYADQALRLSEVYDKDSGVHDHLIRADQWLGEEERRSPWNRDVRRFRRRVKSVLLGGVP